MLFQLNLQRFGDYRMKCEEVFWKSQKLSANRGKLHQTPFQENKEVSASGFRPRSWARFTIHTFPVWSNKGHRVSAEITPRGLYEVSAHHGPCVCPKGDLLSPQITALGV